jgi:hypothetical protein
MVALNPDPDFHGQPFAALRSKVRTGQRAHVNVLLYSTTGYKYFCVKIMCRRSCA